MCPGSPTSSKSAFSVETKPRDGGVNMNPEAGGSQAGMTMAGKGRSVESEDWAASEGIGEVLIPAEEIQRRVRELGAAISEEYTGRLPRLIGILKGVTPFMADLIRAITIPVTTDYMAISKYDLDLQTRSPVRLLKDLDQSITGLHVLLVEDIIDSGLTMEYILAHLKSREPASVRVCTIFNKPANRAVDLPLDFIGFDLPDVFVVGYGLDHGEGYRNLPYLAILDIEVDRG
jgi:hypoxanthine phosphoribosyltransferase